MNVVVLDRCAACGKEFTRDDDVTRYRVSRIPGVWADEAMHVACNNEASEFTCGTETVRKSDKRFV